MSEQARRIALALLILRLSLGIFLLLWGIEKLVIPERTVGIYGKFYGITITTSIAPLLGIAQITLSLALLGGLWRRWSYGLATLLHAYSVTTSWQFLIDPWGLIGGEVKHLFLAGVPVLAGFVALYMLRELDLWTIDAKRQARKQTDEVTP
jgi:putative oxidoreductase